jgi:predicted transcriptional regulator
MALDARFLQAPWMSVSRIVLIGRNVLSVIQVMEKKGFLKHTVDGNTHIYRPCVAREPIVRSRLAQLVKLVFAGKPSAAIQTLLNQVSPEELAEIRRLLDVKASTRSARKKA